LNTKFVYIYNSFKEFLSSSLTSLAQIFGFLTLRWVPVIFATSAAMFGIPATFEKILFGGAGKNGSTVAVRRLLHDLSVFRFKVACPRRQLNRRVISSVAHELCLR